MAEVWKYFIINALWIWISQSDCRVDGKYYHRQRLYIVVPGVHEHLSTHNALQEIQQVLQESRFLNQHHVHEIKDSCFHQHQIATCTCLHFYYHVDVCARSPLMHTRICNTVYSTRSPEFCTALGCYLGPFQERGLNSLCVGSVVLWNVRAPRPLVATSGSYIPCYYAPNT